MACSKITFQSRAEAKAYARGKNFHGPAVRPYKCSHRDAHDGQLVWHLTSQTKVEGRRIARELHPVGSSGPGERPGVWRPPAVCRCERKQPMRDEDEVRCLACGRAVR